MSAFTKHPPFLILLLIVLLTLSLPGLVAAQSGDTPPSLAAPLILTNDQGEYPLGLHLEILEDPSTQLTIQDISSPVYQQQFVASREEVPNFGLTASAYWVRFRVRNETSQTEEWLLEMSLPGMNYIDLYTPVSPVSNETGFEVKRAGLFLPFAEREIAHHHFVFKLPLAFQTEETVYLRFASGGGMILPLTLWSPPALAQKNLTEQFVIGLFYGIVLVMIGYNAFLLLSLRDQSYLYLVLQITARLLLLAEIDGRANQFLWPYLGPGNRWILPLLLGLSLILTLKFATTFLETKNYAPKWHLALNRLMGGLGLLLLLIPFVNYGFIVSLLLALAVPVLVIDLVLGVVIWRQGYRPARFFVIAELIPALANIIEVLIRFDLLPDSTIFALNQPFSIALRVLLLSLALADRINLLKSDTEQANRKLHESESRLTQFLEAMPVAVAVYDAQAKLEYINQETRQIFRMVDQPPAPPPLRPSFAETISHFPLFISGSQQPYPLERLPLLRALQGESCRADDVEVAIAGQRVALEVWAHPIFDEQGQVQYAVSAFQNISGRKQARKKLEQYAERLNVLHQIDQAILQSQSPQAIAEATVAHVQELVAYDRVSVVLIDNETNEGVVLAASVKGETNIGGGKRLSLSAFWLSEDVQQGQVAIIEDFLSLAQPTKMTQTLVAEGIRSALVVPLLVENDFIGIFNLGAKQTHAFSAEHAQIIQEIANSLAITIQQSRLREQIQDHATQLEQRVAARTKELAELNDRLGQDIRERQKIEEALRFQKTLLEAQNEATLDGILVVSPERDWLFTNRQFIKMWNLPEDIKPGYSSHLALQQAQAKALNPSTFVTRVEYIYDHPDEETRDEVVLKDGRIVDRYSAPIRSAEGVNYGRVWYYRDITEQKQAEKKFRQLLEATPDALIVVNQQAQIVMVNAMAEQLFGYRREELIDQPINILIPSLFHANHTAHEKIYLATPQPRPMGTDLEVFGRRRDGREFPVEISLSPLETETGLLVLSAVRDITERQQAEVALRRRNDYLATLHQITLDLFNRRQVDEVLQIIVDQAADLLDAPYGEISLVEGDELVVRAFTANQPFLSGDRLQRGEGLVSWRVYDSRQPVILNNYSEWAGYRAIYDSLQLQATADFPILAGPTCLGVLALGRDRPAYPFDPEQVQVGLWFAQLAALALDNAWLFDRMQQAQVRAEAANQAKTTFLASMSHELRTPLNGILGYTQILKQDSSLAPYQFERLAIIQRSGEHLLMLINDILDIAKIEAGKLELDQTTFDFPSFLRDIADIIRLQAGDKDNLLTFEPFDFTQQPPPDQLPAAVRGDEKRLRQVLINLLGNAVKFTEGGQVIFRVSRVGGQRAEQVPHLIRFEVEDTGPGIPPEQLDTIFEPFQQAGPSKRHTGGSGLGLTICRNLVEAMGSRLQVVSIPEQGSIFWFDVNLPEVAQDAVVSSDPSRKIIGFKGEGSKILVVDDQADNRAMFIDLLSPLGFEIVEAESGQAGLKKAIEFQPDAIITDLIMPDLDGYELARRLRQTPGLADKIILATSASIFAENQQKCFAAGCDDFIPKPVKASHLFELLHRHLALEWVYADQQPEPDHYDNQVLPVDLILPPPKTLATLQELALVGDIRAIRQRLTHLENSDPRLQPFVETLNPLLKNFQMNKMQELLKQWLEA